MPRAYQLTLLAVIVIATVSCRDQAALARRSEQWEVVSEGSASGVTSTVVAPGETPAPLLPVPPSITDTNMDTTTSFTILDATTATSGTVQPGTLADTLPSEQDPPRPRPAPRPSPPATTEPAQPSEPAQPLPTPPPEPPREEKPAEPPREDKPSEPPPPPTSTTSPPRGEVAERSEAGEGREELARS